MFLAVTTDSTTADWDFSLRAFGLFPVEVDGMQIYPWLHVTCLTPGAMSAMVTKVAEIGNNVFSLEVTPWKFPGQETKERWKPGVHLFEISVATGEMSHFSTIATLVVPPPPQFKAPIELSDRMMQTMLTVSQQPRRTRYSGIRYK